MLHDFKFLSEYSLDQLNFVDSFLTNELQGLQNLQNFDDKYFRCYYSTMCNIIDVLLDLRDSIRDVLFEKRKKEN